MTFISYAQNFEDVMLWRALKHVEKGFYIDIGAAWPDEHSVTKAFYERGWHGINVEPNPEFSAKLRADRPRDLNLQVAVSDSEGSLLMSFIDATGLSTLDDRIAEKHEAAGWKANRREVSLTRLCTIWRDYVTDNQEVHFMKIDVEGFEEATLRGNDWSKYRPWVVVIEATLPMSQEESHENWEPILLDANYYPAYADGLNRFYVAQEHSDLLSAFKYPPNVFDNFKQQAQQEAETQRVQADLTAQQAEAKAQQAEAKAQQAEAKAQQAEAQLHAIYASTSWRLTEPLRVFNPRRVTNLALTQAVRFVMRHPRLVDVIKPRLKSHPRLWERLKRNILFAEEGLSINAGNNYSIIKFDRFDVFFSNGPTLDKRGIGRVSRELLRHLEQLSTQPDNLPHRNTAGERRRIYFFSSIHWCPTALPSPSVVMIHDVIPLLYPEHFPTAVVQEWEKRYYSIARQADHIVTISEASANAIVKTLGVPRDKISVVHNGVSEMPVAESCSYALPKKPYVVFLGSYDHHKNLEVVLLALNEEPARHVHLVMIGDNKGCADRVARLGLSDRVHFAGRLTDAEVGLALKKSIGLVFPSLYEGFGLPPLEAAALGVPSICSNRPAMNELIIEGALFCEPDDPKSWANAIWKLKTDRYDRSQLLALQEKVATEYNWEKSAKSLLSTLGRVAT